MKKILSLLICGLLISLTCTAEGTTPETGKKKKALQEISLTGILQKKEVKKGEKTKIIFSLKTEAKKPTTLPKVKKKLLKQFTALVGQKVTIKGLGKKKKLKKVSSITAAEATAKKDKKKKKKKKAKKKADVAEEAETNEETPEA